MQCNLRSPRNYYSRSTHEHITLNQNHGLCCRIGDFTWSFVRLDSNYKHTHMNHIGCHHPWICASEVYVCTENNITPYRICRHSAWKMMQGSRFKVNTNTTNSALKILNYTGRSLLGLVANDRIQSNTQNTGKSECAQIAYFAIFFYFLLLLLLFCLCLSLDIGWYAKMDKQNGIWWYQSSRQLNFHIFFLLCHTVLWALFSVGGLTGFRNIESLITLVLMDFSLLPDGAGSIIVHWIWLSLTVFPWFCRLHEFAMDRGKTTISTHL